RVHYFFGGHVDTIDESTSGRRRRRTFDPAFTAELVAACQYPGVSVAAIALEHGLNANLLRGWVPAHERYGHHGGAVTPVKPPALSQGRPASAAALPAPFVPCQGSSKFPHLRSCNFPHLVFRHSTAGVTAGLT